MARPFQFSLRTLLLATTGVAILVGTVVAIFGSASATRAALMLSILGFPPVLAAAWVAIARWQSKRPHSTLGCLVLIAIAALLASLLPFYLWWAVGRIVR